MSRVALLTREGSTVELEAVGSSDASIFILGGEPYLDSNGNAEPIVQHGILHQNRRINAHGLLVPQALW
jgi:hypothetical protein